MSFEKQGAEGFVEEVDSTEADGADGVAVVTVAEGKEGFSGLAEVLPILEGDFGGDFHGGGAIVGVEDFGQRGWGYLDEALGQDGGGRRGKAEQGGVSDFVKLVADGPVDLWDAVAVDVAPEAGDAVEVAASLGVDEEFALAAFDFELVVAGPVGHGCEGVPEAVPVGGVVGIIWSILLHGLGKRRKSG